MDIVYIMYMYRIGVENLSIEVLTRYALGGILIPKYICWRRLMKRSIDIPDTLYEKLAKIAKEQCVSIAAVIKIACSDYVKKYEKESGQV